MRLFDRRFALNFPYRSVGLSCSALTPDDAPVQLDFLGIEENIAEYRDITSTLYGGNQETRIMQVIVLGMEMCIRDRD